MTTFTTAKDFLSKYEVKIRTFFLENQSFGKLILPEILDISTIILPDTVGIKFD